MFEVETVRARVEWGSFTTARSAPSTVVSISPPGAATGDVVGTGADVSQIAVPLTPRDDGLDSATEDVSATSIDTSAL